MVGTHEGTTYEEYCAQLRMTSDQLDEVKEKKAVSDKMGASYESQGHASNPTHDTMDWEPSASITAARTRPRNHDGPPTKRLTKETRKTLLEMCRPKSQGPTVSYEAPAQGGASYEAPPSCSGRRKEEEEGTTGPGRRRNL